MTLAESKAQANQLYNKHRITYVIVPNPFSGGGKWWVCTLATAVMNGLRNQIVYQAPPKGKAPPQE